jgi:protein-S-isoprenylcysteine O-methyltransferase Ste14
MARRCFSECVFKLRGLLMLPPLVFITASHQWEVENEVLVFGLGGFVFALGLLLRLWAQAHLHYRLALKKLLTTAGPYTFTRNPIYLGNCLILVGVCFLCEMFWFAPIMLGWCAVVYHFAVAHEEAHLAVKYGQSYMDYVTCVPRWLPRKLPKGIHLLQEGSSDLLAPSLLAEVHCLLFMVPPIVKELIL